MTGCTPPRQHRRTLALALVATALLLSGCTRTRTVTVQGEAPPPSVVTVTDTLRLASPPDTLYLDRVVTRIVAGDTVRQVVTRTVPVRVTEYVLPRPDSSRAFRLHALTIDSATVRLDGTVRDFRFRRPEAGETLVVRATGLGSVEASVVGTPSRPPPITVECPACPECLYERSFWGRIRWGLSLLLALMIGAGLGVVVARLLPFRLS